MDNPAAQSSSISMSKRQYDALNNTAGQMFQEMKEKGIITIYDVANVEEMQTQFPEIAEELLEKGIISPENVINLDRVLLEMPRGTYQKIIDAELVSPGIDFNQEKYDAEMPALLEKYGERIIELLELKDYGAVIKLGQSVISAGLQLPLNQLTPMGVYLDTDGKLNFELDKELNSVELSPSFTLSSNGYLHKGLNSGDYSMGLRGGFNHHSTSDAESTFSYDGSSIYIGVGQDQDGTITGLTAYTGVAAGERIDLYGRFDATYRLDNEETNFQTEAGASYKIFSIQDVFTKMGMPIPLPLGRVEAYGSYECESEDLSELKCDTSTGIRWSLEP